MSMLLNRSWFIGFLIAVLLSPVTSIADSRKLHGAILGAVAGALIADQVYYHDSPNRVVIGAFIGAAAGYELASSGKRLRGSYYYKHHGYPHYRYKKHYGHRYKGYNGRHRYKGRDFYGNRYYGHRNHRYRHYRPYRPHRPYRQHRGYYHR